MRGTMRIRDRQSLNCYDVAELESSAPLLKSQQSFDLLFQSPRHSRDEGENEALLTTRERLSARFTALMKDENARYRDPHVSIHRKGEGQLCWRLLSGALKGCTLYVRWHKNCLSVEINAPAMLAKRLLTCREGIEQHVALCSAQFLVDIKITSESEYV